MLEERARRDAAAVASAAGLTGQDQHVELSMEELLEMLRAIVARSSIQPDLRPGP